MQHTFLTERFEDSDTVRVDLVSANDFDFLVDRVTNQRGGFIPETAGLDTWMFVRVRASSATINADDLGSLAVVKRHGPGHAPGLGQGQHLARGHGLFQVAR